MYKVMGETQELAANLNTNVDDFRMESGSELEAQKASNRVEKYVSILDYRIHLTRGGYWDIKKVHV